MKIATVELDLAKTLFQVHGVDLQGHIVVRKQLRRADVLPFFAKLEPCVVGMEACAPTGPHAIFFFRHDDGCWCVFPPTRAQQTMNGYRLAA